MSRFKWPLRKPDVADSGSDGAELDGGRAAGWGICRGCDMMIVCDGGEITSAMTGYPVGLRCRSSTSTITFYKVSE